MGLEIYTPLTHGNPGWRFWLILVLALVAINFLVRLFYHPG